MICDNGDLGRNTSAQAPLVPNIDRRLDHLFR